MNNSQKKPEYVLFIMNNCKFSSSFINKLKKKQELFEKFNIVDVEKIPSIPTEVTEVPCVYDGKLVYAGTKAFTWLDEKLQDYLLPADDCINYSFIDGSEEPVFSNYSLLNQFNGSNGMGDSPVKQPGLSQNKEDVQRMTQTISNNKNKSLESLMAERDAEIR